VLTPSVPPASHVVITTIIQVIIRIAQVQVAQILGVFGVLPDQDCLTDSQTWVNSAIIGSVPFPITLTTMIL